MLEVAGSVELSRFCMFIILTPPVSTDLCRVVIAVFLVHQILWVFDVIRRVQFTRDSPAVVWHASPLRETLYLTQLAVWRGYVPDEIIFQSFSGEMVNEIQNSAVIFQRKGKAAKIKWNEWHNIECLPIWSKNESTLHFWRGVVILITTPSERFKKRSVPIILVRSMSGKQVQGVISFQETAPRIVRVIIVSFVQVNSYAKKPSSAGAFTIAEQTGKRERRALLRSLQNTHRLLLSPPEKL